MATPARGTQDENAGQGESATAQPTGKEIGAMTEQLCDVGSGSRNRYQDLAAAGDGGWPESARTLCRQSGTRKADRAGETAGSKHIDGYAARQSRGADVDERNSGQTCEESRLDRET